MVGQIYVWKAQGHLAPKMENWFTIAQVLVTRTLFRHASWGVGTIYGNGTQWQLEADLCVATTPIAATDCRVFKINAPDDIVKTVTITLAERYAGETYGFLSLLNFIGRAIVSLFGADGRMFCPIRYGDVCSALVYAGLQQLAATQDWEDLTTKLNEWHRNCFQPSDVITVCAAFPKYFAEVTQQEGS